MVSFSQWRPTPLASIFKGNFLIKYDRRPDVEFIRVGTSDLIKVLERADMLNLPPIGAGARVDR